jgi:hypothetical protein
MPNQLFHALAWSMDIAGTRYHFEVRFAKPLTLEQLGGSIPQLHLSTETLEGTAPTVEPPGAA